MTDHRPTIRRVGWVLLAMGAISLAYMVLAHFTTLEHTASGHVMGIFAGLVLILGDMATVRKVVWFLALWLTVTVGIELVVPLLQPWGLQRAAFAAAPAETLGGHVYGGLCLLLVAGSYWALRRPVVRAACARSGVRPATPWTAFALGALVVTGLVVGEYRLNYTPVAGEARAQARAAHGAERGYYVVSLAIGKRQVTAELKAYDERGVRPVTVEWTRQGDARQAD